MNIALEYFRLLILQPSTLPYLRRLTLLGPISLHRPTSEDHPATQLATSAPRLIAQHSQHVTHLTLSAHNVICRYKDASTGKWVQLLAAFVEACHDVIAACTEFEELTVE